MAARELPGRFVSRINTLHLTRLDLLRLVHMMNANSTQSMDVAGAARGGRWMDLCLTSLFGAACLLGMAGVAAAAEPAPAVQTAAKGDPAADAAMREGGDAAGRGDFKTASGRFAKAADLYAASGQTGRRIDAMVRMADAARSSGNATTAIEALFTHEKLDMGGAGELYVLALATGHAPDQTPMVMGPMAGMHMDHSAHAGGNVQDVYIKANPNTALALALKTGDKPRVMQVEAAIGVASMFSENADAAEPFLSDAARRAEELKEPRSVAAIENALATLHAGQRSKPELIASPIDHDDALMKYEKAKQEYDKVIEAATKGNMPEVAAKAAVNKGVAADHNYQYDEAVGFDADALKLVTALTDSYAKANLLMTLGQSDFKALSNDPELRNDAATRNTLLGRAYGCYQQALAIGQRLNSPMTIAYAGAYTAELYEQQGRLDEALVLNRRALFIAQQQQARDAVWRWEWQTGRILRAKGELDGARDAYTRATDIVFAKNSNLSNDIGLAYGNQNMRSSFREQVGPLLFGLADLLLRDSEKYPAGSPTEQKDLKEARATIEKIKQAELEDYLQDSCSALLDLKQQDIDVLAREYQAALIYFIPLPDRTEMLVTLPDRIHRYTSKVTDVQITKVVRRFRDNLEDKTTNQYIEQAVELYDWLIKPMAGDLEKQKIKTLVVIPDGALRTIPLGALREGGPDGKFLIQKYDVAVSPGLRLMEISAIARKDIDVLSSGLSEGKKVGETQFSALPHVKDELKDIHQIFGGTRKELIDSTFTFQGVSDDVKDPKVTVVHMATHGVFSGDSKKTFLVTFDKNIDLADLQMLIAPKKYGDNARPVELLTLSACQTAKGDDRAALGLAGVAIKAGARSAYATLWSVNDDASARLIDVFYRQLHDHPEITKAAALRKAQEALIKDPKYSHPYFWSPCLIIGNWL